MKHSVTLTLEQTLAAVIVGSLQMVRREQKARKKGERATGNRSNRERWADAIHGALAEQAVAAILGKPWTPGSEKVSHGDVAHKYEVRATDHENGHLVIYRADPPGAIFALAVGHYPTIRLAGFIRCDRARIVGQWRTELDPPCWWVRQDQLAPTLEACEEEGAP